MRTHNFMQAVPPVADTAGWSRLMTERDGIARAWSIFMADRPLLLSPTWTQLPFENGFAVPATEISNRKSVDIVRGIHAFAVALNGSLIVPPVSLVPNQETVLTQAAPRRLPKVPVLVHTPSRKMTSSIT
ncbi:MAG: hypothetical protein ABSG76_09610 [Xanthobacteraceae bacterium]